MKNLFVFFWLGIIILVTSWYFLMPGMFYLHDFLHTARIAEVASGLSDGHFPVRWSQNFGYGYGEPVFEFYAPLPYYFGAALLLIGVPALTATKLLFVLCNIGTSIGSYYLGKSFYGRIGGLLTAAAISLAPYRAVNLYVRGALSELWGGMAVVWIIFFLWQTARGRRRGWVGLTVALVVLFLSHNLMTLIFAPFAVVLAVSFCMYTYFQYGRQDLWQRVATTVGSFLLATSISAFYLIPAFVEKGLTQVERIIVGGYFDYAIHFVYVRQFLMPNWGYGGSTFGPQDGISFFLGYGQLITVAVSLLTLLISGYFLLTKSKRTLPMHKWLLVASFFLLLLISLLLATEKTLFLWSSIHILQFVQFPWRFLTLSAVFMGIVAPFFLMAHKSFLKRWLLGMIGIVVCFPNVAYFKPLDRLVEPTEYYTTDPHTIQTSLSATLPDYLPTGVPVETISERPIPQAMAQCPGSCGLEVQTDKVAYKMVTVTATVPSQVMFSVNYFPGWIAKINGIVVQPSVIDGLIQVPIPVGRSQVSLEFADTQLRSIADIVSLFGVIVFGITYIYQQRIRHEAKY